MIKKEMVLVEKENFVFSKENKEEIAEKASAIKKELAKYNDTSLVNVSNYDTYDDALSILSSAGVSFVKDEFFAILEAILKEGYDTFFKEVDDIIENAPLTVKDFKSLDELKDFLSEKFDTTEEVLEKVINCKNVEVLNALLN